jgi:hypothetical protein
VIQAYLNQFIHVMIIQGIIQYLAIPAVLDQGQILKTPDLMGYGRLTETQERRQITDAHFTSLQGHGNFKPCRISQCFVNQYQAIQLPSRNGFGPRLGHPVKMDDSNQTAVFMD